MSVILPFWWTLFTIKVRDTSTINSNMIKTFNTTFYRIKWHCTRRKNTNFMQAHWKSSFVNIILKLISENFYNRCPPPTRLWLYQGLFVSSSVGLTVIRCFKHFVTFRDFFGKDERQFGQTTIDKIFTMIWRSALE